MADSYRMPLSLDLSETPRIKHQLTIHVDYDSNCNLAVMYSYPQSAPPLGEQVVRLNPMQISSELKESLDLLYSALKNRIVSKPIRMPHTPEFMPRIVPAIMTVNIQDQQRPTKIPHARLYYSEVIPAEFNLGTEKQVHMKPEDFSPEERRVWERIRDSAKGIAEFIVIVAGFVVPV